MHIHNLQDPVVVEEIRAHAGIDIGQTLIGMHLKAVAVPVRTSVRTIGEADCNNCNNTSKAESAANGSI